jgi:ATP-binding cassette subfamily F protein uup
MASVKENEAQKLSYNEQKELKNLESKLRALELDKKALELQFNDTTLTQEQINTLSEALQKLMDDIAIKEARWFELSEKLE